MNNNYLQGSSKYRPNPDHPHKHMQESLLIPPEKPNPLYVKPYRLVLNSSERDGGTIDNAIFNVDVKDTDIFNHNDPYMMVVESFVLQNTVTPIGNKLYYIRLGNLLKPPSQNKDTPKDIIQTVFGASYYNQYTVTNNLGVLIHNKAFFQNRPFNVYFTNNTAGYTPGTNSVAEIADGNSVWSLTLTFFRMPM